MILYEMCFFNHFIDGHDVIFEYRKIGVKEEETSSFSSYPIAPSTLDVEAENCNWKKEMNCLSERAELKELKRWNSNIGEDICGAENIYK